MSTFVPSDTSRRYILVADEDPTIVAFIVHTLREDNYAVFHALDGLSAVQLAYALRRCDLVITDTRVNGMTGTDLVRQLRRDRPELAILYIANIGRSSPEIEQHLPPDVTILREPFTTSELRAAVRKLMTESQPSPRR